MTAECRAAVSIFVCVPRQRRIGIIRTTQVDPGTTSAGQRNETVHRLVLRRHRRCRTAIGIIGAGAGYARATDVLHGRRVQVLLRGHPQCEGHRAVPQAKHQGPSADVPKAVRPQRKIQESQGASAAGPLTPRGRCGGRAGVLLELRLDGLRLCSRPRPWPRRSSWPPALQARATRPSAWRAFPRSDRRPGSAAPRSMARTGRAVCGGWFTRDGRFLDLRRRGRPGINA